MTERPSTDALGLTRLGYSSSLLRCPAVRWEAGGPIETTESVIEEIPVSLIYNDVPHVVMMTTPQDLEDFALGFSFTERLVEGLEQISGVEIIRYSQGIEIQLRVAGEVVARVRETSRSLVGRTGCGICGAETIEAVMKHPHRVAATATLSPAVIKAAMAALGDHQILNREAGAVHAVGWSDLEGNVRVVREDVGRHNAMDKVVGALLRAEVDPASGFFLITSRASFEMVQKAAMFGARFLVAVSGATGLAVRLALETRLTLIGFARGDRLTIYAHPEAITPDQR